MRRSPSGLTGLYARLLQFGFRLLYNELAWTYDLVANVVSLGKWWQWQRQTLPFLPPGSRVLEVGHGTGHLLADLIAGGQAPIGFDLSPQMGRIARQRLARQGQYPLLVRGRVQALPFATHSLPAIVASFPTEYIVDPAVIREFWRVLLPGGRVVFVPSATLRGTSLLYRAIRWLFYVTGQSTRHSADPPTDDPDWPPGVRESYAKASFAVRVEVVDLPHSRVYVVVAEKGT